MKVKLLSGWSNPGGSTEHHISLTNLLNENGYDCTFYGPHPYHLSKCKSDYLHAAVIDPSDIVISHFLKIPKEFKVKKHILSCHETNLFPLKDMDLSQYDLVHCVSERQWDWHGVNHPHVVIAPRVDKIKWTNNNTGFAGVVGSIDDHKQPHLAVKLALEDGYDMVKLYGKVTDQAYFDNFITPLWDKVQITEHEENKDFMYNSIDAVYHTSKRETYGLVEAECKLAGIPFKGACNDPVVMEDKEILEKWSQVLM